jgi:hypothetical protein
VLRDISFISKLRTNLISLGQLPEIGHRVVMDYAEITVSKKYPPRLIMCVQRKANKLYKIEFGRSRLALAWHARSCKLPSTKETS